ncbi:MAG: hypothetical protein QOI27_1914 [Gaiellaceae bacterium]|jgi:hypothetical protein|nr:hypothetical protein [Gaiellaceae bacterium]MDX6473905.1 hypothetical protein [Gaiellaceae bacterium]
MATQTPQRVTERPLDVVLRPDSPAEAAYRSAVLAPGFEAAPDLNLRYLGGRTLSLLAFRNVYLGSWDAAERTKLDGALAAAMEDAHLNNVLAQYFPGGTIGSSFAGSHVRAGAVPPRVYRDTVESIVTALDAEGALAGLDLSASAVCLLLPEGAVLVDGDSGESGTPVDSTHGLGGYHGSVHVRRGSEPVYYAVSVYSKGGNGIVAFDEPWKNVCATLYHELCEIRTDPDVEDAIRAGATPGSERLLGWYSPRGGEIGDIPMAEVHGSIKLVMQEVPLAAGSGTVPIQLMWSNAVSGPEGPISRPHSPR